MNNGEKKKKSSRTLEELVNRRRIHFRVLERVAPGSMIGMVPFIAEAVLALSVLGIGDPEDSLNPHNTDGLSFPDFSDEELPAMAELTPLRSIRGLNDELLDIGLIDFSRDSNDYKAPVRDSQVSGSNDSLFEYDFTADNAIGRGSGDPIPPGITTIPNFIPPGGPGDPTPPGPPPFKSPLVLLTPGEDPYITPGVADSILLSDASNSKDNPITPYVEGIMDAVRNQMDSKLTPYQNEYLNARSNTINSGQSWSLIANAFNPGLPNGGIVSYDFWLKDDSGSFKAVGSSLDSLDGELLVKYGDYALQEGQIYQTKVLVTDASGNQASSFSDIYVNKGPLFLAPGDIGNKTPGIVDDPSMTDPAHTNDNPATNYVEGRLDAVMNQVGNPLTISNVIANDKDWQAVANAFDTDGFIQRYDFWVKDNSGDFVSLAHDSDSLKSGIITVDYQSLDLTPGASYDMKVRAIDNNGAEAFSFDTFRVNLPPDALPDSFNTNEDTSLKISAAGLLANDSDPDSNPLVISAFTSTSKGLLNYDGTNFTYNPNANYNGPDSFTYTIGDGQGGFDTTTVSINVTPINDLPVAIDDLYIAQQDTLLSIPASGVLVNDYDTDSPADPLNVDLSKLPLSSVKGGTIALNLDGSFSYKGAAGFSGLDSFEYWVSDGQGGFDNATVNIVVSATPIPLNNPPVAVDDTVIILEDSSISFNALDGVTITGSTQAGTALGLDSDPDANPLTLLSVSGAKNGTVSFLADGTVNYKANAGFNGTEVLEYSISDGQGGFDLGQITVNVLPVNDPPVAVDDSYLAKQDTELTINPLTGVLVNDFDTDTIPDPLNVDLTKLPLSSVKGGSIALNLDGSFSYKGAAGFSGLDSFEYWVSDGQGGFDNATVNIVVSATPIPLNNPPVAVDDTVIILEDSSISFNALDGVTITGSTQAGTTLGLDSDPDANPLTLLSVSGAKNGTVSFLADGTVNYTANAGFNGTEILEYSISDGQGGFDLGQITVNVLPVNDPPVAVDDSYLAKQDITLTIAPATGVLTNDFDTDTIPDPLNVDLSKLPFSSVKGGSIALNLDGSFSYKGAAGFSGLDSFEYWVSDGQGGFDNATVNIVVTATPIPLNNPPVAVDDTVIILEDSSISFNALDGVTITGSTQAGTTLGLDSDPDANPLTLLSVSGAKNGIVSFLADGTVNYTANAGFNGTEILEYSISDGQGGFDLGQITVNVLPVNDPPVAVDDSYLAKQDTELTINPATGVLINDFDTDTIPDPLSVDLSKLPLNSVKGGTIALNLDGSFSYKGAAGFSGLDSFEYWVSDGQGGFDNAIVNIVVTATPIPLNNPPVAVDDTVIILEDSSISFNALDGVTITGSTQPGTTLGLDSDPDANPLTLLSVSGAKNGIVSFLADGTVNYTANAGFNGTEILEYSISDGQGGFDLGQITVNVLPVNDPPVAVDDSYLAKQDTELTINPATGVLINDFDTDTIPDPLNVDLSKLPLSSVKGGSIALNLDGSFSYKGAAGFSGLDSFEYWVSDGQGGFDNAIVNIVVTATPIPLNNPPVAVDDTVIILEDSSISFNALDGVTITGSTQPGTTLGLDSDPDANPLTLLSVSGAKNGTVSFLADGTVNYTANAGFNGTEILEYSISDGQGGFDLGQITLKVLPVDDLPSGGIDAVAVPSLVYNDTDQIQFGDSLVFGIDVQDPDGIAKYSFAVNGTEDNKFYLTAGDLSTAINAYGAKLAPGSSNDLSVKVYDAGGNAPVLFTDKILVTAPEPIANLLIPTNTTFDIDGTAGTQLANSGWNPGSVTLDATSSKASNTLLAPIAKYEFDFNNDGTYDYYETASFAPDGSFDGITSKVFASGKQTVALRVTDIFGFSDTTRSSFDVNSAPDAKLISPVQGAKDIIINLLGNTSTDPEGNLLEYQFEIFDSANKLLTTIEEYASTADGKAGFIFSDLGKYKIVLTTTDTLGLLDTSTNFIQIVTDPQAGLNIDGDLNNSGSINQTNGRIPEGPGTERIQGGGISSLGNKTNTISIPGSEREGFTNTDKNGFLFPKDEGAGVNFNAGLPSGPPPVSKPGWSIVNVDAWINLDATTSLSASGLAGGIESYQFDFNNDGIIDYTESKTDLDKNGTFEYFFELQGSQILTPTDKLQVDLINGGLTPVAVTVSINPTEIFTGASAIEQAESFLESYNLLTSMQSSDPNKLAFGKEDYTVTFEYADGSKVSQVEYFYLIDSAKTFFDNKFDGVTKFKFIPGYQVDPDTVPHLFASEYDITSEFIDAKVTITDEFGLTAQATNKFQLNFKSLLPPTASLDLFYNGQQQDVWEVKAGQKFYLDTSAAFDPDGNVQIRFIDIGVKKGSTDGTYEFSGSSNTFAQEYVIYEAGTYKIGTIVIDDGGRISPPVYETLVVTPNARPVVSFDLSGDIYDARGFAGTFEPVSLESTVTDPDGDDLIRTEFYFNSGGSFFFSNPSFVEWKGGYDQNGDGKISIINVTLMRPIAEYYTGFNYTVQANEALDFSQDGLVDGKVDYTYGYGGNQKVLVAAYDEYGAKGWDLQDIEVKYALFTDVETEQYVFNARDPVTGEKNSVGWVQASDSYAIFGEITKYEFDFDASIPPLVRDLDYKNETILAVDYYEEWLAGADGKFEFEGKDAAEKALFALDDQKYALDGKFDGKFEGDYFYEKETSGVRYVAVRITDNLGNQVTSRETLLINAAPTTNVQVSHADPNKPASLVLIDSVSSDELDRTGALGIQKAEFNIFEVGDIDGDGKIGELVYSYAEGAIYDGYGNAWITPGLDGKLGTSDDVPIVANLAGSDKLFGTADDLYAPDGTWSGSHKYTFPQQGEYKVVSKVTDFFGLSATSETNFFAYEGTPDTNFLIYQLDGTGAVVKDGQNYDPNSTYQLYNADAGVIVLDASATKIPDGKGEITEFWFESGVGNNGYDYIEVREAGLDNQYGTSDDLFSAFKFTYIQEKNTIIKEAATFDGAFDGKHEFQYEESDSTKNILLANVKAVSSTGAYARSFNTLWSINSDPYSKSDTVAVHQIDPGKDGIWGSSDDRLGAPQYGILEVTDSDLSTKEFVIDAGYRVFDLESFITKYQFWLDQDGNGAAELVYSEEWLAGKDGIFETADDVFLATDGSFDGKYASSFLLRADDGQLDIREVKTQVWDHLGYASKEFTNYITINDAPTNDLELSNAQLGLTSTVFGIGQKVQFDSQSDDVNQIFTSLWKTPGNGANVPANYFGPYDFLGKLGKYEFEIYDQSGELIWQYNESEPYYYAKSENYTVGATATYADSIGIAADGKVDGKAFFSFDKAGSYTIKATTSDFFGLSDSSSVTISIVEAPDIVFVASKGTSSTLQNNTIDFSASALGGVSYSFDLDGDGDIDLVNSTGLATDVAFAKNGDFVPSVTVVDNNGLVFSETLKINTPQTIGASGLPKLINPGDKLNYYFGIFSDTNNDLSSFRLEFDKDVTGDGLVGDFVQFDSNFNVTGGNAALISNIDNFKSIVTTAQIIATGSVQATLYAIDDLGLSASATHKFSLNNAPTLDLNVPSFAGKTQTIDFNAAQSTDPENNLVKYSFDFNNDGKADYIEWARGYDHDGNKTLAFLEASQDFALDGKFDGLVSTDHLLDTNGDKKGDTSIRDLYYSQFGKYDYTVTIEDSLGLKASSTATLEIVDGPKILATGPSGLIIGKSYELSLENTNTSSAPIAKYYFDFNYDGTWDYIESASSAPDGAFDGKTSYDFSKPGEYNVKVQILDEAGVFDQDKISFKVNSLPVISSIDLISKNVTLQAQASENILAAGAKFTPLIQVGDADNNIIDYSYRIVGESGWTSASTLSGALTNIESYDTSILASGKYQLEFKLTDALNQETVQSSSFTINTAPNLILDALPGYPDGIVLKGQAQLSLNTDLAIDPDKNLAFFQYKLDGDQFWSPQYVGGVALTEAAEVAMNALDFGAHSITVRVVDSAGGESIQSDTFNLAKATSLTLDAVEVSVIGSTNASNNFVNPNANFAAKLTLEAGGSPISSYQYRIDQGVYKSFSDQLSFQNALANLSSAGLSAGSHNLEVLVTDAVGAVSQNSAFTINSAPTGTSYDPITSTVAGQSNASLNVISGLGVALSTQLSFTDANNDLVEYSYKVGNNAWANFSSESALKDALAAYDMRSTVAGGSLVPGESYLVQVKATDSLGLSSIKSGSFSVNAAPGSGSIDLAADRDQNLIVPGSVNFAISAPFSDVNANITGYEYSLDGQNWLRDAGGKIFSESDLTIAINAWGNSQVTIGEYSVSVRAVDGFGLTGPAVTDTFKIIEGAVVFGLDAVSSGPGAGANIVNPAGFAGYSFSTNLSTQAGLTPIEEYNFKLNLTSEPTTGNWILVSDLDKNGLDQADLIAAINKAGSNLTQQGLYTLSVKVADAIGFSDTATTQFTLNDTPKISFFDVVTNTVGSDPTSNLLNLNAKLSSFLDLSNKIGNLSNVSLTFAGETQSFFTAQEVNDYLNAFDLQAALSAGKLSSTLSNSIQVTVTDQYGLSTNASSSFDFNEAPIVTGFDPVPGRADNLANAGQMNTSFTVSDADNNTKTFFLKIDSGTWDEYTSSSALRQAVNDLGNNASPGSSYSLSVKVADSLGLVSNIITESLTLNQAPGIIGLDPVALNISDNPATTNIIEGANNLLNSVNPGTDFQAKFTIEDDNNDLTSYEYRIDNTGVWTSFTGQVGSNTLNLSTTGLAEGKHTLEIKVADSGGFVSSNPVNFTINAAPKISSFDAVAFDQANKSINIGNLVNSGEQLKASLIITDDAPDVLYQYSFDGQTWISTSAPNAQGELTLPGQTSSGTVQIKATDLLGLSSIASSAFTINAAPVAGSVDANINSSDSTYFASSFSFGFTGAFSDTSGSIVSYQYSFDGGTSWSTSIPSAGFTTAINAAGQSLAAGSYNLQVKAIDSIGVASLPSASQSFNIATAVTISSFDAVSTGGGQNSNVINPLAQNGFGFTPKLVFDDGGAQITNYAYSINKVGSAENWVSVSTDLNLDSKVDQADLILAIQKSGQTQNLSAGNYELSVKLSSALDSVEATSAFGVNEAPTFSSFFFDAVSDTASPNTIGSSNIVNPNITLKTNNLGFGIELFRQDVPDGDGKLWTDLKYEYSYDNGSNWKLADDPSNAFFNFGGSTPFYGQFALAGVSNDTSVLFKATDGFGLSVTSTPSNVIVNKAPNLGTIDANIADSDNIFGVGNANFGIVTPFTDTTGTVPNYQYRLNGGSWSANIPTANLTSSVNAAINALGVGSYNLEVKAIDQLGLVSSVASNNFNIAAGVTISAFDAVKSGLGATSNIINPNDINNVGFDVNLQYSDGGSGLTGMFYSINKVGSAASFIEVKTDLNADSKVDINDLIFAINETKIAASTSTNWELSVKLANAVDTTGITKTSAFTLNQAPTVAKTANYYSYLTGITSTNTLDFDLIAGTNQDLGTGLAGLNIINTGESLYAKLGFFSDESLKINGSANVKTFPDSTDPHLLNNFYETHQFHTGLTYSYSTDNINWVTLKNEQALGEFADPIILDKNLGWIPSPLALDNTADAAQVARIVGIWGGGLLQQYTHIVLPEQTQSGTIYVKATDDFGLSSQTFSDTFTINQAPTKGTIDASLSDSDNVFFQGGFDFAISSAFSDSTGAISAYQYKFTGQTDWSSSVAPGSLANSINSAGNNLVAGIYTLEVRAIDQLGLISGVATSNFELLSNNVVKINAFDAIDNDGLVGNLDSHRDNFIQTNTTSIKLATNVTNSTNLNLDYKYYLDLNKDGDFNDAGELIGSSSSTGQGNSSITYNPSALLAGKYNARLDVSDASSGLKISANDYLQVAPWLIKTFDVTDFAFGNTSSTLYVDSTPLDSFNRGQALRLLVDPQGNKTGVTYQFFVDSNRDGDFDDTGENLGAGLEWGGSSDFRYQDLPATKLTSTGDYQVKLVASAAGVSQTLYDTFTLKDNWSIKDIALSTNAQTADATSTITNGTSRYLIAQYNNSADITFSAETFYIDFNKDGDFADAGESEKAIFGSASVKYSNLILNKTDSLATGTYNYKFEVTDSNGLTQSAYDAFTITNDNFWNIKDIGLSTNAVTPDATNTITNGTNRYLNAQYTQPAGVTFSAATFYLDFNKDGDFADAGESEVAILTQSAYYSNLIWNKTDSLAVGTYNYKFELTDSKGLTQSAYDAFTITNDNFWNIKDIGLSTNAVTPDATNTITNGTNRYLNAQYNQPAGVTFSAATFYLDSNKDGDFTDAGESEVAIPTSSAYFSNLIWNKTDSLAAGTYNYKFELTDSKGLTQSAYDTFTIINDNLWNITSIDVSPNFQAADATDTYATSSALHITANVNNPKNATINTTFYADLNKDGDFNDTGESEAGIARTGGFYSNVIYYKTLAAGTYNVKFEAKDSLGVSATSYDVFHVGSTPATVGGFTLNGFDAIDSDGIFGGTDTNPNNKINQQFFGGGNSSIRLVSEVTNTGNDRLTYTYKLDLNKDGDFTDAGETASFDSTLKNVYYEYQIGEMAPGTYTSFLSVKDRNLIEKTSTSIFEVIATPPAVASIASFDPVGNSSQLTGLNPNLGTNTFTGSKFGGGYNTLAFTTQINNPNNSNLTYNYAIDLNKDGDFIDSGELVRTIDSSLSGEITTEYQLPELKAGDYKVQLSVKDNTSNINLAPVVGQFTVLAPASSWSLGGFDALGANSQLAGLNPDLVNNKLTTPQAGGGYNTINTALTVNNTNSQVLKYEYSIDLNKDGDFLDASEYQTFYSAQTGNIESVHQIGELKAGLYNVKAVVTNEADGSTKTINDTFAVEAVTTPSWSITNFDADQNNANNTSFARATGDTLQTSLTVSNNAQTKLTYKYAIDLNKDGDYADAGELLSTVTDFTGSFLDQSLYIPQALLTSDGIYNIQVFVTDGFSQSANAISTLNVYSSIPRIAILDAADGNTANVISIGQADIFVSYLDPSSLLTGYQYRLASGAWSSVFSSNNALEAALEAELEAITIPGTYRISVKAVGNGFETLTLADDLTIV